MQERLTIFLKTVSDFADERCAELENQAKSFKNESISAYKSEAEAKNRSYIEYETGRILSSVNRQISDYEAEKKTALTALRSEITDKVFASVTKLINDFTLSENYEQFLLNSALELKATVGDSAVFFLRPADMKYADILREKFGAEVKEDDKIFIGGLRASDKDALMLADDTFDTRLDVQRAEFAEKSGLKIY
ncbi:MAG: hypothetical protein J1F23_05545 [Oscillospiraceae bacterium]|nr:hypothetical protein [Oscillospiraceae bacterium]